MGWEFRNKEKAMNNKSFSQLIKKSNTDEWYTPQYAVNLIIPYLSKRGYKKILCPFDKEESNFVKRLTEEGFDVTFSHIETGTDFFEIDNLTSYDCVVSNPPFSKREKIFEKLFESGVPFALIINMNGLFDSKARWELFKNNKFEILVPKGRMKFANNEGEKNSPNFQSIYVCNNVLDKQIEFCDMNIDK